MAEFGEMKVSLTLSIDELAELTALLHVAEASFPEGHHPTLIDEISDMFFQLMESLQQDGVLGDFEPE